MNTGIDPGGELGSWDYYGDQYDVFVEMGAPAYEPYDPFAGWTPSAIKHFPIEAYEPDPYYQAPVQGPLEYLYETGSDILGSKSVRDALFGWTLQEIGLGPAEREVSEGAGVTVIHSQAPAAGGAVAQPVEPYQFFAPAGAPPQAVGTGTMILIGAGLVVLYFLFR